jgi:transposase
MGRKQCPRGPKLSAVTLLVDARYVVSFRANDYLKGLYWDGSGLCLFARRLERSKFVWPPLVDGTMTLTPAQLAVLIEAMDWRRTIAPLAGLRPMLL